MTTFIPAGTEHINDIREMASVAWPRAFENILSATQIDYMMQWMYSPESLRQQMETQHHRYFLARCDGKNVGYMSIEHHCGGLPKTKIHKLYVLPHCQKTGIGKACINFALSEAAKAGDTAVYLNVNKYNQNAIGFYQRTGFSLVKAEVIDIGNGFVMDDFVFEKKVLDVE